MLAKIRNLLAWFFLVHIWRGDPFILKSKLAIWGLMHANPSPGKNS